MTSRLVLDKGRIYGFVCKKQMTERDKVTATRALPILQTIHRKIKYCFVFVFLLYRFKWVFLVKK